MKINFPDLKKVSFKPSDLELQKQENFKIHFLELVYENKFSRSKKGVIETVRPGTTQIRHFQQKKIPRQTVQKFC